MTSILDEGRNLSKAAFSFAAEEISIFRGSSALAEDIPAKIGKTLFRTEDQYGVSVRTMQIDFITCEDDFSATPEVGDMIQYDGKKFQICAPNDEPCWRWHITGKQKRIHAKYTGPVTSAAQQE